MNIPCIFRSLDGRLNEVVVVVLLSFIPDSFFEARGMETADRSPRSDPEIPHIYDVVFWSKWSQDRVVFHINVLVCVCVGWPGRGCRCCRICICNVRAVGGVHSEGRAR